MVYEEPSSVESSTSLHHEILAHQQRHPPAISCLTLYQPQCWALSILASDFRWRRPTLMGSLGLAITISRVSLSDMLVSLPSLSPVLCLCDGPATRTRASQREGLLDFQLPFSIQRQRIKSSSSAWHCQPRGSWVLAFSTYPYYALIQKSIWIGPSDSTNDSVW